MAFNFIKNINQFYFLDKLVIHHIYFIDYLFFFSDFLIFKFIFKNYYILNHHFLTKIDFFKYYFNKFFKYFNYC
jgi:hypothetical protein